MRNDVGLILTDVPMIVIWSGANHGPVCDLHNCDEETLKPLAYKHLKMDLCVTVK